MKPIRIALFASGSGSLLPGFVELAKNDTECEIACLVLSKETPARAIAEQAKIPTLLFPEPNHALIAELKKLDIKLICLAGYLKIISAEFIEAFERNGGVIINTHPALLPKFGGKGMYGMHVHKKVSEAQETETGFTVHEVIAAVDEGPIIAQKSANITAGSPPESIRDQVVALEKLYYPDIAFKYAKNKFGQPGS